MQGSAQNRKFVTLAEALSWIAFRTFLDVAGIKERLLAAPSCGVSLEEAMRQFSIAAGDGRLRARGRFVTDADNVDPHMTGYGTDIPENQFIDLQQFDLDRERLQCLPPSGSRVLGTWGTTTNVRSTGGDDGTVVDRLENAGEYAERTFWSYAGVKEKNLPSYAIGYEDVEVTRDDLLREYPIIQSQRPLVTHQEVVAWCLQKIGEGTNDMNLAWSDFKSTPQFAGLSRDDVLRPAWNDAKIKS